MEQEQQVKDAICELQKEGSDLPNEPISVSRIVEKTRLTPEEVERVLRNLDQKRQIIPEIIRGKITSVIPLFSC
jgi:hypothetical protein